MVDARNKRIASSTCVSVATVLNVSLASASVIRIMASNWRTVMGMEERSLDSSSDLWTCLRMETKWEDRRSAASGERTGAQRL